MSPNSQNPENNLGKNLLSINGKLYINNPNTEDPVNTAKDLERKAKDDVHNTEDPVNTAKDLEANIPALGTDNFVESAKDLEHIVIRSGGKIMDTIKTIISNNKNLKSLHLICSQIDDSKLSDIMQILTGNVNIETLNFRQNQIGDEGVKKLVNKISQFPDLKTIDLSENQIGDEGVKELKDAVSKKPGLEINIDGQKPGQNPTNPSIKTTLNSTEVGVPR